MKFKMNVKVDKKSIKDKIKKKYKEKDELAEKVFEEKATESFEKYDTIANSITVYNRKGSVAARKNIDIEYTFEDNKFIIKSKDNSWVVKALLRAQNLGTMTLNQEFIEYFDLEGNSDDYFFKPTFWFIKFKNDLENRLPKQFKRK